MGELEEIVLNELFTDDRRTDVMVGEMESFSLLSQRQYLGLDSSEIPTTILCAQTLEGDNVDETDSSKRELGKVQMKLTYPKKQSHMLVERRRKANITKAIEQLGSLLPNRGEPHYNSFRLIQRNKVSILKAAVDYLSKLKDENRNILLLEEIIRVQESKYQKLCLKVEKNEQHSCTHDLSFEHLSEKRELAL